MLRALPLVLAFALFACGGGAGTPSVNVVDVQQNPQSDNVQDLVPTHEGLEPDIFPDVADLEETKQPEPAKDSVEADHTVHEVLDSIAPTDAEKPSDTWQDETTADISPPLPAPCAPCKDDTQCEGVGKCLDLGYSTFVCGMDCGPNSECPQGFLCELATAVDGNKVFQCIPADRCPCTESLEGVKIPCTKANDFGTCHGFERCISGEWLACDAREPAAEECNGIDDNCDGQTDEGFGKITCGLGICAHTIDACKDGKLQICDPMEGAQAEDLPDPQGLDTDCDGIDGTVALSIFVSATLGDDSNPGTMDKPKKTIGAGILAAVAQNKRDVLISEGDYVENVTLVDGISLHGGYRASENWKRYPGAYATVLGGTVTLTATDIASPTRVSQMLFVSKSGSKPGEHSIGAWLANCSQALVFEQCAFRAGSGAAGAVGKNGQDGASGGAGGTGGNGCENGGLVCEHCSQPPQGAAGTSVCGRTGGAGGAPGLGDQPGKAGSDGCCTTPGGAGGPPRQPGQQGLNGANGADGSNGVGGQAYPILLPTGILVGAGQDGAPGGHGNGGGGGGGGGGNPQGCIDYGGAGGGGGGGGCGGEAGTGGGPGGSSVAVVAWQCQAKFIKCTFQTSAGGNGGAGGSGGNGGVGGVGGNGGGGHEGSGPGGKGGNGGKGGRGGHGGGGAGGSSIAILCQGPSVPFLSSPTFLLGEPGKGGASLGSPGEDGLKAETLGCE